MCSNCERYAIIVNRSAVRQLSNHWSLKSTFSYRQAKNNGRAFCSEWFLFRKAKERMACLHCKGEPVLDLANRQPWPNTCALIRAYRYCARVWTRLHVCVYMHTRSQEKKFWSLKTGRASIWHSCGQCMVVAAATTGMGKEWLQDLDLGSFTLHEDIWVYFWILNILERGLPVTWDGTGEMFAVTGSILSSSDCDSGLLLDTPLKDLTWGNVTRPGHSLRRRMPSVDAWGVPLCVLYSIRYLCFLTLSLPFLGRLLIKCACWYVVLSHFSVEILLSGTI